MNFDHIEDISNQQFFGEFVRLTHGFCALYNTEGKQSYLTGNHPPLLPSKIEQLLIKAELQDKNLHNYDYTLLDYYDYDCYIYAIDYEEKQTHIVMGMPKQHVLGDLAFSLPIGIVKITSSWQAYFVNQEAQLLFGRNEDELLGNQWSGVLSLDIIGEIHQHFKLYHNHINPFKKIYEFITPLGRKYVLSILISENFDVELNDRFYCMVVQDITKEYEANQRTHFSATHDTLTSLYNRSALLEMIHKNFDRENLENVALLFLDLDGFKSINDTHGHSAGDEILKIVAKKLVGSTKERDIVARIGGDEFIIFLNNVIDESQMVHIAKKIADKINNDVVVQGHTIRISASIGISLGNSLQDFNEESLNDVALIDQWFQTADIAMYESKKDSKNDVVVFNKDFHKEYVQQIEREKFLHKVMNDDLVDIHFQPVYYEEKIFSLEALARFEPREFGSSIDKLLLTAHRVGNSLEFYDYLSDAALRAYKKVLENYKGIVFLNVNIAVVQIFTDGFAQNFLQRLQELQIDPALVYIELTEQALETQEEILIQNISTLKHGGIKFSIDDFGTGYSSIKRLIDYDFNQIKLDRSFFYGIESNRKLQIATKVATQLGDNLGMQVLAEGIETKQELEFVEEYGIAYIQGYLFSKPLNFHDIITELNRSKV